jgi:autotransporter-associated beta strand protein
MGGGGTAYFDFSSSISGSNDLIQVNGPLSFAGQTTVVINPTNSVLANGNYPLFDYTGTLSYGSSATTLVLAPGAINARQSAHFDYGTTTPGVISLDVVGGLPLNLTWIGGTHSGATNVWSANGTSNTAWSGNNYFANGDTVTFDASSANTTVSVSGTVNPSSVTVAGANNYTFTGSGSIGGGASLVVQGPGSLTIGNAGGNSYNSGTFIQGGSIKLGVNNGLPTATTLTLGSETANGTFDMAGYNQTLSGLTTDFSAVASSQFVGNSAASTTSTLTFSSNGASSFDGTIRDGINGVGGKVALTVNAGQLTLGGSNTYTGPTTISSAGTLQLNGQSALYSGAATNNLLANGVLDLNGFNASVNALSGSGSIIDSSFTPGSTLTIGNNNASSQFSGPIGSVNLFNNPSINKVGSGTITLSGVSYAPNVTVNQGMLVFSASNNATNVTVSQGTLQATTAVALGTMSTQFAVNGNLYLNYDVAVAPAWANISGPGTLELNSAQPVNSSAAWGRPALPSTFTGTLQVDNGRVDVAPTNLGGAGNIVISDSSQFLAFDGGYTLTSYTFSQNFSINGYGWGEGTLFGAGSEQWGALRVSGMNANFAGNINLAGPTGIFTQFNHPSQMTISGSITGSGALTISDNYTTYPITISGSNNFTGTTTIGAGTVDLANSAALLNSTLISGSGAIAFDPSVSGHGFTFGGLSGTGAIALSDTAANPVALTMGNNNSSNTYSGTLSGPGSLKVIGTGILTLSGTNTYTGGTTVASGTLIATNSMAIADGTNLAVGDPALLTLLSTPTIPASAVPSAAAAIAPVPEPGTLALLAAGGAAIALAARRRMRIAAADKR